MSNSGTKWPEGYKGFVSAVKPDAPTILTVTAGCAIIELTWSYVSSSCIPVSSFYIFFQEPLIFNL
jgi:hypothetical protein